MPQHYNRNVDINFTFQISKSSLLPTPSLHICSSLILSLFCSNWYFMAGKEYEILTAADYTGKNMKLKIRLCKRKIVLDYFGFRTHFHQFT